MVSGRRFAHFSDSGLARQIRDISRPDDDYDDQEWEFLLSYVLFILQTKPQTSAAELKAQEEEELQLAMALSLSAAESEKQVGLSYFLNSMSSPSFITLSRIWLAS